jgi:hypothetical protein
MALKEMGERFVKAWKTGKSDGDLLQFQSPAALFRVLTAKRWELIERLQTTGPTTLRGLARELDRDDADRASMILLLFVAIRRFAARADLRLDEFGERPGHAKSAPVQMILNQIIAISVNLTVHLHRRSQAQRRVV